MISNQKSDIKSAGSSIKLKNIFDYLYVLLGISCFVAVAIVTIFLWNVHQSNELLVLRENLKNELVVNDIKKIVQMVLKDAENDYRPQYEERKRYVEPQMKQNISFTGTNTFIPKLVRVADSQ